MAFLCELRSLASRTKTLIPHNLVSKASLRPVPSSEQTVRSIARVSVVLACTESLMPLHSTIAASRLKSNIGINSAYWSCLSQDYALPR